MSRQQIEGLIAIYCTLSDAFDALMDKSLANEAELGELLCALRVSEIDNTWFLSWSQTSRRVVSQIWLYQLSVTNHS